MPEGPEVRRFAMSLAEYVSGKTLRDVEVISGRYTKSELVGLRYLKANLPTQIIGVGSHGKFIYWIAKNDIFLHSSLGMSGEWSLKQTKHTRVKLIFDDMVVYYNDSRNFGTLKFVPGKSELIKKLTSLGPDMLAEDISNDVFISLIQAVPEKTIVQAIMNQKIIAGVGNYVKAESLWLARLSPHRIVSTLSDDELSMLNNSIKSVLRESFQAGATATKSYQTFNGKRIKNTRQFSVFNRSKDPDGNEVVKEKTADGRTTYWVPSVQR